MALTASDQLPIIDFSKDGMKPGTDTWDLTGKHVREALEEYGCFMATFDEINHELYTSMFRSLEKLFDLPKDTKRRFTSDKPFLGYTSDAPQYPLYEAMGVLLETVHNLSLLMWPQGDAAFCETLLTYSMGLSKLEQIVRKMIFQAYGVDKYFEEESESVYYNLRLSKYETPMTDEDTIGAGVHFDKNFISILQADRDGLQVLVQNGEWIRITPTSPSLIVIAGELLHGWSNGRVRCCPHRVRVSGSESRYSIGLFSNMVATIEVHNELVDEEHPLLFKPFDQDNLLKVFIQQLMDKNNNFSSEEDNMIVPTVTTYFSI